MESKIIKGVAIAGRAGRWHVGVERGLITAVEPSKSDAGDAVVYPGFVDIHNHGAVGVDVNGADADDLVKVGKFLATRGVTSWLPTLVPDSDENYARVISAIDEVIERQIDMPIAQAVGVHYEGVFANEKMCGALRPQFFKKFTGGSSALAELPVPRSGVRMMTFAPEIDGGVELAAELTAQGWIASIGHTNASLGVLDAACDAGARHVTHFFNAMTGVHHRDVGVAGWALTRPDVTFDIIADGIHVQPRMVKMAVDAKGFDSVALISDSVAPTGLGDGNYELWGEKLSIENGRTRNERGSIAGSVIAIDDAVSLAGELGFAAGETAAMASRNPARIIGLSDRGSMEEGKRADLTAIDAKGNVVWTMVGGLMADR